jgi:DNA invertase Pin-like site-specific DNA recombinase
MPHATPWTPEEEAIIRKMWAESDRTAKTDVLIGMALDRTASSVAKRRADMGLEIRRRPRPKRKPRSRAWQPGEPHPAAKLSMDDVREIRALCGVEKQRNIARRLGIARATVSHIQRGDTWRWL